MSGKLVAFFGAGWQGFDNLGRVAASGTLSTFLAGSGTPQNTYTDSGLGTSNGSVITLGSNGRPANELWIPTSTNIKVVFKDSSGNQLDVWDNIPSVG